MTTIPKNTILQSKGLGDTIGDIVESFNLDLSSNYGAVRTTRMKKITNPSNGILDKALAFCIYNGVYYVLCNNYVFLGETQPSGVYTSVLNESDINTTVSDMKVFNDCIYVSASDSVWKSSNGTLFTEVISTNITESTPHLLEVFTSKLYMTDGYTKVYSISDADVLTYTGAGSIDLGLDSNWSITTLKAQGSYIWIGLLNSQNGKGLIYSWDGNSTIPSARYELPSGVVAGTILDNVLYIIDIQGCLKKYSGNSFTEVAKLQKNNPNVFEGSLTTTNSRYVHPNGMQITDRGTILILLSNKYNGNEIGYNNIPSGIWEYDSNIGLYHKYSVSDSLTTGTILNDYGQQRIESAGALYVSKPSTGSTTVNGILICGAEYFTNSSSSTPALFCDDTFDTTTKWGYFVTTKIFGKIQEQWNKIYAIYKKFINSTSEIIIKYRTEEDIPTETTITWVDIDRFTSSVSLSAYAVGDEVQVIQGTGSGQSAHIKEIIGSTYILDENFPTAVIGLTSIANVSKWIKAGKITSLDEKQFKPLTIVTKNMSPFIQFKVCMKFNGKDELNKLEIISKNQIIE